MKIYFIRHAQADNQDANTRSRLLTLAGYEKAQCLERAYQDLKIDAFYSSPYARAVATIQPLANHHHQEIELVEDFREREANFKIMQYFDLYMKKQWDDFSYKDEGESLQEVVDRYVNKLQEILKLDHNTVVIGTHGVALCALLKHYDASFSEEAMFTYMNELPCIIEMNFQGEECRGWKHHSL